MNDAKSVFLSKTAWFGLLTFVAALLAWLNGQEYIAQYPQVVAAIGMLVAVVNVALRFVSNRPVFLFKDQ